MEQAGVEGREATEEGAESKDLKFVIVEQQSVRGSSSERIWVRAALYITAR